MHASVALEELPDTPIKWNAQQVQSFLSSKGFPEEAEVLYNSSINGTALIAMRPRDLAMMGIHDRVVVQQLMGTIEALKQEVSEKNYIKEKRKRKQTNKQETKQKMTHCLL